MDFSALARPSVRTLSPYRAGTTIDQAKREYGLDRVVKLSSNENPLGPSPKAMAALANIPDAHLYADDDHTALKARLAATYGLTAAHTFLGHGSNDILMTFFATFVAAGDEVVMADPTFSLFPAFARIFDARVVAVPLRAGVHDLEAMAAAVTPRTKLIVICDPNNPSSTCVDPDAFARFLGGLPERVLVMLDQAYREYMPSRSVEGSAFVAQRPGTIVTRTMSKLYGLASIRFGYGFADPGMIDLMQRVRVPFNVARPATIAAWAAIDDTEFVARTIAMNDTGRAFLEAQFGRLGLAMYPSAANFVAVRVPTSATNAYTDLLKRGVVTRSGDALGLPGYLRITIGTPDENATLIAALEASLPAWHATPARVNATVTIRRGERGDRPFVLDLGQRVASTSISSLRDTLPQLVASAFRNLAEYVWTRDHDTLIAESGGRALGFVLAIYDLPDEVSLTQQAFVAYMAVEPEAQRRGVGRALLDEVERLAAERGLSYVSLMVTEENAAARGLYERSGFGTERRMMTKIV